MQRALDERAWRHAWVRLRQLHDPRYQPTLAQRDPQWVGSRPWGTAPIAAPMLDDIAAATA